jgi:hypothetical protein
MWRTRVPRVVWCFCAAFIMASATAAADVRFTGPTSHADQADQEEEAGVRSSAARLVAEAVSLPMHVLPDVTSRPYVRLGSEAPRQERPGALTGLYVSFAALQALDAHSTLRAVDNGALEANPLVAPIADRPGLMFGMKAAAAVTTIVLAEKLWRRNRVAAVVLMVAANAAYAAVVASNYGQARR